MLRGRGRGRGSYRGSYRGRGRRSDREVGVVSGSGYGLYMGGGMGHAWLGVRVRLWLIRVRTVFKYIDHEVNLEPTVAKAVGLIMRSHAGLLIRH